MGQPVPSVLPTLAATNVASSVSLIVAGAGSVRRTCCAEPLVAAETAYSEVTAFQYWPEPTVSPNVSSWSALGSPGNVTVTMTGFLRTEPPLLFSWPIAGVKAGYVSLGAPWSSGGGGGS